MKRRYEFRYNTVLGDLEYRQRDSIHFYFQPADQRVRSSIAMKALKEGVRGTATSPASCLRTTCRYTTPSKNIL